MEPAENQFRAVLQRDPANRDANYNLGVLLMVKGDHRRRNRALSECPSAEQTNRLQLVRAYFDNKKPAWLSMPRTTCPQQKITRCRYISLSASCSHPNASTSLRSMNWARPTRFSPALLRSFTTWGRTFFAMNILPSRVSPDGGRSHATRFHRRSVFDGPDLANESRPLDALDLLIRAHKPAPENTDVIFLMARISMSQSYYEDAIPLLESGVQLAPRRTDFRSGGELLHGRPSRQSDRTVQQADRPRTLRALLFLSWTLVSQPRPPR